MMHRSTAYLNLLFTALIILFSVSCKECPFEPDYDLHLSVRFQGCKTIKFNVSWAETKNVATWILERNDSILLSGTRADLDTVLTDNTVSVDNIYKYQLLFYDDSDKQVTNSNKLEVTMLPSTSHEFTWTLDTLGYSGNLYDVFAVSENDVWVVGEFEISEPDTIHQTEYTACNAAHWDGTEWEVMYIPVFNYGTDFYFQLYSVYGFSMDEVYFLSHNRLVMWNGSDFVQKLNLLDVPGLTVVEQLWGRSGDELYIGGTEGFLLKTDGENWEMIPAFTDKMIRCIVGDNNDKLWLSAENSTKGDGYYYYFDGKQWGGWGKYLYPDTIRIDVDAICAINNSYIINYVGTTVGRAIIHSQDDYHDYDIILTKDFGWWIAMDGNDINDFFGVGELNLVTHFNGEGYQDYPELSGFSYWYSVDQIGDLVFIVGDQWVPLVARGRRN